MLADTRGPRRGRGCSRPCKWGTEAGLTPGAAHSYNARVATPELGSVSLGVPIVAKPDKVLGLVVGLVILMTILGIDVVLMGSVVRHGPGMAMFFNLVLFVLSLPLLALWTYWYSGLATLSYFLDRNALTIDCGIARHTVPLPEVVRIVPGSEVKVARGFRGVGWPGYLNGAMQIEGIGQLLTFSTEPLDRQMIVVTPSKAYGISPRDPQAFESEIAVRQAVGAIRKAREEVELTRLARLALWRDRTYWLALLVAFVANLALLGFIMARYELLPERIPLRFSSLGEADYVADRVWVLVVPIIGALTWLTNALLGTVMHQWERLGAHLLATTALGVQVVLWFAAVRIIGP